MLVNRLEPFRGNRHGQHRACLGKQCINDQFRLCFVWTEAGQRRLTSLMTTDLLLVHPGEVLLEEFLRPMGISQYRLALAIGVQESRIYTIAVPFLRPQRRLLAEDAGQP